MSLHIQYITDKKGKAISVILPIEEFKELVEVYGIDLSHEEIEAIERGKLIRTSQPELLNKEYADLNSL